MVYLLKINYFLELNYIKICFASIEFFKASIRKLGELQKTPIFFYNKENLQRSLL